MTHTNMCLVTERKESSQKVKDDLKHYYTGYSAESQLVKPLSMPEI